jgi:hypothetical protein
MSRRIRPSYISDVVGRIANEDSRFERKRREQTAFIREAGGKGFSYSVNKRLGLVKIDGLPYTLLDTGDVVNPENFQPIGEIEEGSPKEDRGIRFVFEDKDAYVEHKEKERGMTEEEKAREYRFARQDAKEDTERERREEERERRQQQDDAERERLAQARDRARFRVRGEDDRGGLSNEALLRLLRGEQPTPLIPTGKQAELQEELKERLAQGILPTEVGRERRAAARRIREKGQRAEALDVVFKEKERNRPRVEGSWRDQKKGACFTRTNANGGKYVVCNDPPRGSKGQQGVYQKKDRKDRGDPDIKGRDKSAIIRRQKPVLKKYDDEGRLEKDAVYYTPLKKDGGDVILLEWKDRYDPIAGLDARTGKKFQERDSRNDRRDNRLTGYTGPADTGYNDRVTNLIVANQPTIRVPIKEFNAQYRSTRTGNTNIGGKEDHKKGEYKLS